MSVKYHKITQFPDGFRLNVSRLSVQQHIILPVFGTGTKTRDCRMARSIDHLATPPPIKKLLFLFGYLNNNNNNINNNKS